MKLRLLALLCAAALLLSACRESAVQPPEGAYEVYFAVAGEEGGVQSVDFEYRTLPEGDDEVSGLVQLLLDGPQTAGLASPFLSGVRLNKAELGEDGLLHVDLSEQYNGLPGVYLTVANACLTLTLGQVEGVEGLYLTVEGEPLPYQTVQPLHAGDFILSGAEEESVSVNALLYFPRQEGGGLGAEYRMVTKTEEDSLPAAVLAALLEGPRSESLAALMPADTLIRSVKVENGLCKVDLSEGFRENAPTAPETARLVLYSVVNTLCALEELDIQTVQLYVEGAAIAVYGDVPTLAPLEPDYSLAK